MKQNKTKLKGTSKAAEDEIEIRRFFICLTEGRENQEYSDFCVVRNEDYDMFLRKVNKLAFSSFDDKNIHKQY